VINKNFLEEPNLVDLSKEIYKAVVQDKLEINTRFNLLSDDIYDAETINFILADGLGYENLNSTDSYLNQNVTKSINTTFPSSTNVALSSIAFMRNPIEHGLIGYYMFDKSQYGLINALNWNENNKNLKKSIHESTLELWNFCKKKLQSGEYEQMVLDEIFLAIDMKIIDKDDLISTLENRFISGDVILTGTDIPKDLLLMANQITELRS